jgi:hypothetical protein
MEALATESLRIDDEWRRWLAENLILGADPRGLFDTLIGAGASFADAKREIEAALASPYIAGAERIRNRLAKRNWVLDNQRRMNRLRPAVIPRMHRLSAATFLNDFYSAGRPVIITGMIDDWPARKKWSLEYFGERLADRVVEVQSGRSADERYEINCERHKKPMRFGDYVDLVRSAGRTNDFYITANNGSKNRVALAELWDDIVLIPEYLSRDAGGEAFFWFGPAGTITPFHHDLTNNFMAQVVGRKRVLLAPPWEIENMYNDHHCYTPVDGRSIDYARFPALRDVQVLECTIGAGDLLFLPVGCWHFVEALDISVTVSFTNFRWDNDFTARYPASRDF